MTILRNLVGYFIPPKLRTSTITYRKARLLVYVHLAMIGLIVSLTIVNQGILHERNEPTYAFIPIIIGMLFLFRKTGNFTIAANIVGLAWFAALASTIHLTGGLHSDDIIWLMIAPLMVMLFSTPLWGFAWLMMLNLFYIGVLMWSKSQPHINTLPYSDNYYAFNYIIVNSFIFLLLAISEINRAVTIRKLDKNNRLLNIQKQEITKTAEALKIIEQKLIKTNIELETFAYAASHDLKEPLRMIKMYTELIKRSMTKDLTPNQTEYMFYVIDGVSRMQKLLDDLLQYSRLGKNSNDNALIDLNERLLIVKNNLTVLIQETGAEINVSPLPTISGSATEMSQLFQNIIANAIKFRRADVKPIINIRVEDKADSYIFSIEDNGIGIAEQYQEQIFALFKKLHSQSVYEGSGIGLATCKKIVENMNGRIWLSSTEGVGTTFYFSIPKNMTVSFVQPNSTPSVTVHAA